MARKRSLQGALVAASLLAASHAAAQQQNTDPAPDAAFERASKLEAIAEYADAASSYEDAVRRFPKETRASSALKEAVILRLGLGDINGALKDADLFEKLYGVAKPAETLEPWLAMASFSLRRDDFETTKKLLAKRMAQIDRAGSLDDRIRAHTWLARSMDATNDAKGAQQEYERVLALWKERRPALGGAAAEQQDPRKLAQTLTAVGETLFFFAEKKRVEADAIRYPEYKGPGDKEAILRHINTKVADWIKRKRLAIEEAEKAYLEIVQLEPVPPPKWVIASASNVGIMWGHFVAEFRAAPIPREWRGDGPVPGQGKMTFRQLREIYYQTIDQAAEPLKRRAKQAFKVCLDYSVKFQFADSHTRTCSTWLEKNYHAEFRPLDELMPAFPLSGFSAPPEPVPEPPPR